MQTLVRIATLDFPLKPCIVIITHSHFIVDFGTDWRVPPVQISSSGLTGTAGETGYLLMCSTLLVQPLSLPCNVTPIFQWFFGPNGNGPLPSGATPFTINSSISSRDDGISYTSTLLFPRLSQRLHAGMYTCQIGAGSLANRSVVSVNGGMILHAWQIMHDFSLTLFFLCYPAPDIVAQVTPSGNLMLGKSGYSLSCRVSGTDDLDPFLTYQWTKKNGTQIQIQLGPDPNILSFSPLRLSDAGEYSCQVNVSSYYLSNDISVLSSHVISIKSEFS